MKKLISVLTIVFIIFAVLSGCSNVKYKDGVFEGISQPDARGNYGVVTIIIEDGNIKDASYTLYLNDGIEKDENYGQGNEENYLKAQEALKKAKTYPDRLIEVQDIKKVDVITGATSSHNEFIDAAKKALEKAKK